MRESDNNNNKKNKVKMSRSEMGSFLLDTRRFPRDFLTIFMGSSGSSREKEEELDDEEIELNLGLSLGGRFGVDKSSSRNNNKLIRSSSIAECLPIVRDDNDALTASNSPPVACSSLIRTSSLPVETEEEWRKRKESETLRRMAAKRRRSEKQRNLKVEKQVGGEEEKFDRGQYLAAAKRFSSSVAPPFGWTGMRSQAAVVGGGIDVGAMAKGKGSFLVGGNLGQLLSQGSVGSQQGGWGSSSELESNKPLQGCSSCGDLSPGSNQPSQKGNEQVAGSSRTKTREGAGKTSLAEMEDPSKQADTSKSKGKETKVNALGDMPCVFTKGDGPNGRRIEGILYKYGKGEDVRIMCVCHGSFLTPAEFIKHAGGTDVNRPLKHIVLNPNASPFL